MIIIVRKKYLILVISIILILIIPSLIFTQIHSTNNYVSDKVIVIDPGHGGHDPGAIGNTGISEKDINLKIAQKLKILLEQNGYTVVLTREKDVSLHNEGVKRKKASDIKKRKEIINTSNAKLMVSIHLNSFSQEKYSGAQVFYPLNSENSKLLGELIQGELKAGVDNNNDRQAKSINTVLILKDNNIPSVIVECGFLSNQKEEQLLNTDDFQQLLAKAICSGIMKFVAFPTIDNTVKVSV